MNKQQAFIVVSTGQKVANLPPILEMACKGDVAVWIESKDARRYQWSNGARKVLEKHGLTNCTEDVTVEDINDPAQVLSNLRPVIEKLASSYTLNLVANGGQKFTPIGLLKSCSEFPFRWLYGQPKPAELWIFNGKMDQAPQRQAYRRHVLELEDILTANELVVQSSTRVPMGAVPADAAPDDYGRDPTYTARIHEEYFQYHREPQEEVSFKDVQTLLLNGNLQETDYTKWLKSIGVFFQNGYDNGRKNTGLETWGLQRIVEHLRKKKGLLENLFSANCFFAKTVASVKAKAIKGTGKPSIDIGNAFERAVLGRVLSHLQSHPGQAAVIQLLYRNVRVATTRDPAITKTEWDIALVLKNGVIVAIECKSFDADQKDLDARVLNLLRAGSQAEMMICGPLYTEFANQPWFPAMHRFREKIGTKDFLPFTLHGQRDSYTIKNAQGVNEHHHCPGFEEVLSKRLEQYLQEN